MNKWFVNEPTAQDKFRLFFFPHAGGGASYYNLWAKYFKDTDISVYTIQMPSRETRLDEDGFVNMKPLIEELQEVLYPYLQQPHAFFGHSMGSIIAFELTSAVYKKFGYLPEHLFLSGRYSPEIKKEGQILHKLSDERLMQSLKDLGGTNEQILNNPKMKNLILRPLRSDLQICETYQRMRLDQLPCDTTILGSLDDPTTTIEELLGWEKYFSEKSFQIKLFTGDHFYHTEHRSKVVQIIKNNLTQG